MLNYQKADIYSRLKAREISRQNIRNSENIGHIVLGTTQKKIHVSYFMLKRCDNNQL